MPYAMRCLRPQLRRCYAPEDGAGSEQPPAAGSVAADLEAAGYSVPSLVEMGYTATELREAPGPSLALRCPRWSAMLSAPHAPSDEHGGWLLIGRRTSTFLIWQAGFAAARLRREGGFDAPALRAAGYSAAELTRLVDVSGETGAFKVYTEEGMGYYSGSEGLVCSAMDYHRFAASAPFPRTDAPGRRALCRLALHCPLAAAGDAARWRALRGHRATRALGGAPCP